MQNNFEKGVREKMDELKFEPSEPVWQNIEKQIRNKKDRRRLIFWIPLLILLLSGGVWLIYNTGNDPVAATTKNFRSNSKRSNPGNAEWKGRKPH